MDSMEKSRHVYRIFQGISQTYDGANRRISLGMERSWKRELVETAALQVPDGGAVLDVCCGTGDIAVAVASRRPDVSVTGLDFSPAMLDVARSKGSALKNLTWQEGDAAALPFADHTFSAAAISFGLRNTPDYGAVLTEMTRVVCPGGWVYCLDSFVPDSPLIRPFYDLYFRGVMPLLGGGFRHRREYRWLWQSTRDFLRKHELTALFSAVGLENVRADSHLFGTCALHSGQKPRYI